MFAAAAMKAIIDEIVHHKVATAEMAELLNITELRSIDSIDTEFISATKLTAQSIRLRFNVRTKAEDASFTKSTRSDTGTILQNLQHSWNIRKKGS